MKQALQISNQAAPKEDFNFAANWLKHDPNPESVEIDQTMVLFWLNGFRNTATVYGNGTHEMAALFSRAVTTLDFDPHSGWSRAMRFISVDRRKTSKFSIQVPKPHGHYSRQGT